MIDNIIGIFDNLDNLDNDYDNSDLIGGAKRSNKNSFSKTKLYLYQMDNTDPTHMHTLLIPLPNANTVSVGIFINAGSRQEKSAFGIAHFLEHMTFKGTIKRTSVELMNQLDSIGAQYNAMTGYEFTAYYINGDPRDVEQLLDIVVDLYLNPTYPTTDIDKERNVVLEELRMNVDNNHRHLSNNLYQHIYSDTNTDLNTLGRPIIGYEETIRKMSKDDILAYRKANYMGSNCLLCLSGNFDKESILNKIKTEFRTDLKKKHISSNLFESNMHSKTDIKSLIDIKPSLVSNRHLHLDRDINQTVINIMFNTYDAYNNNQIAVDLFCDILSNGFSSRLFDLLRNQLGISYYNNSYNRTYDDTGHMVISVGIEREKVVMAIEAILSELAKIKKNGITETELAKSKKQNETSLLFQFKDPYEYLMYYGMNYLNKKPLDSLSKMLERIEEINFEQINSIIKQILQPSNIIIGTIGKLSKSESESIAKCVKNFI